jgi:hypothetical protein
MFTQIVLFSYYYSVYISSQHKAYSIKTESRNITATLHLPYVCLLALLLELGSVTIGDVSCIGYRELSVTKMR